MDRAKCPDHRPFFLRRLPEEVRRRLADEATASERTLTAEIIHRLRQSLRASDERQPDAVDHHIRHKPDAGRKHS